MRGAILGSNPRYSNHRVTVLAGGVGGARMAAALGSALAPGSLTVVVNVGDDTERYGAHVAADLDTVAYTLAGVQGRDGWGRAGDTFRTMEALSDLGVDTRFRLGDTDLAACLLRTHLLRSGVGLAAATEVLTDRLGIDGVRILPASDDPVRTWVETRDAGWLDFQTYFVDRGHRDDVVSLAYHGSTDAEPAPGVVEAIEGADTVVVAPSNPPLSIWPILAVEGIARAVSRHPCVVAVSPLFSGKPLKGPADAVMRGVGLSAGTAGILEAYADLIDALVIDVSDASDVELGPPSGVTVIPADTRLSGPEVGRACVDAILQWEAA